MPNLISFNPMKDDEITDVHYFLKELVEYSYKEVCFVDDKVGRYFNPLRSHQNTSICLRFKRTRPPRVVNILLCMSDKQA